MTPLTPYYANVLTVILKEIVAKQTRGIKSSDYIEMELLLSKEYKLADNDFTLMIQFLEDEAMIHRYEGGRTMATFKGVDFNAFGSYNQQQTNQENRQKAVELANERSEKNAIDLVVWTKNLYRWTKVLGIGTVFLVLLELVKWVYEISSHA